MESTETDDPAASMPVVGEAPATQPVDFSLTKTLALEVVPLELTVPESWSIEERGS